MSKNNYYGEELPLGIVSIKTKKLNLKHVILLSLILAIVVFVLFVFQYYPYWKANHAIDANQIKQMEQLAENKVKRSINKDIFKNPILTQLGKDNIKNIYSSEEKIAYLTFDDGPSKTVTPLILDLLKEQNIKATFFTLGSRVELYPELVKREYEEGHYIANHGYSHVYKNIYASTQAVLDEYNQTEQCIQNALENPNYHSHLFRFPGGSNGGYYKDIKNEAKIALDQNNVTYIDWNSLTQDAAGKHTKEELIQNLKDTMGTKNTLVILMHDAGDKILTYEALPEIISYLREQGYTFKNFYDVIV